jgi:hypothetical protein
MGQMTVGILYGCVAPPMENDADGEGLYDLVDRWEKAKGIKPFDANKAKVRVETEGGKDLIGVWVAVGGSGEDGVPYFVEQAMELGDVSYRFATRIKTAEKLWHRFADWAAKAEGIKLPLPRLWLTPCEVA